MWSFGRRWRIWTIAAFLAPFEFFGERKDPFNELLFRERREGDRGACGRGMVGWLLRRGKFRVKRSNRNAERTSDLRPTLPATFAGPVFDSMNGLTI